MAMTLATSRSRSVLAGSAFALLLLVTLSACDPSTEFYDESIQMRLSQSGEVDFVVCKSAQATGGTASLFDAASGEWRDFWVAEDDVDIAVGTIGRIGSAPFGMDATLDQQPDIGEGDKISIAVYSGESESSLGGFEIPDPESIVGLWLSSDGSVSLASCEAS